MVASGGFVYVARNATVHAIRASDRSEAWKKFTANGTGSPALDAERVYLTGQCEDTVALRRQDGAEAWGHETGCSGGGDITPVLYGGRLWSSQDEAPPPAPGAPVFDATNGAVVMRYPGGRPVFVDGLAVTSRSETGTRAIDAATGQQRWEAKGPFVKPLAVGHDLYGFRAGDFGDHPNIVALDAETGAVIWNEEIEGSLGGGSDTPPPGSAWPRDCCSSVWAARSPPTRARSSPRHVVSRLERTWSS